MTTTLSHVLAGSLRRATFVVMAALLVAACSSDDPDGGGGTGGQPPAATGGLSSTGGATSPGSGGNSAGAGGGPASGGVTATGGVSSGGAVATGGTIATGGASASGGSVASGGAPGSGGALATGGASSGGSSGTGGSAGVTCPATSTLKPGETTRTIQSGGMSRTYILHVPSNYTGTSPVPLLVDLHPLLSTSSFQRTNSGYAALSDQKGFIVAYPQGINNAWNVGPCCTTSRTVDDVGLVKAIVAELKSQGCIDPKRVFAAGYSMGGGLSHYLGCHAADVFAAVSPAAFDLLEENAVDCKPARPISVHSFRGTADNIVPYAGGASRPPNGLNVTIHFLGAKGTLEKWSQLNGCTGTPTESGGCSTYTQCKEGTEVTLCTAQGGGHVTGDATKGWAFFERHPMP